MERFSNETINYYVFNGLKSKTYLVKINLNIFVFLSLNDKCQLLRTIMDEIKINKT